MTRSSGLRPRPARAALGLSLASALAVMTIGLAPASAQTLEEALAITYKTNPNLLAARAALRVTDEGIAQAKGGWRPSVRSTLSIGSTRTESESSGTTTRGTINPKTGNLTITQSLYQGGKTEASIRRSESNVQAERANLFDVEQQTLLQASTAYVDVIRDESTLELQINNLQRLQKQLEATSVRFDGGDVTRTDVAQAESRVARAKADRTQAEGNLTSARVIFERIVGIVPGKLSQPDMPSGLPETGEAAAEVATRHNFGLVATKFREAAAIENINEQRADLLPSLNLVGQGNYTRDTSLTVDRTSSLAVEAQVVVPIYQQGITSSRVRAAKEEANRLRLVVEATRRNVVDSAARAFEGWQTAVARRVSLQSEVSSAQIALEGVEQEATVGARTVLDVLDAEQSLLDAQVQLVRAQRDAFVASYQLQTALGRLTAADLGLPVELYDYDRHFREVEARYWGTDVPAGQP